jgi:hypothetical protein
MSEQTLLVLVLLHFSLDFRLKYKSGDSVFTNRLWNANHFLTLWKSSWNFVARGGGNHIV